uniref:ORF42a n=1 Tax=Pinus thunbergii TaxID=3350 RepID=Q32948_PINTH|nr:ORF42a [Pinus thunbergii]
MSIEKERDRMILFLPAVILSLFGRLNPNRKKRILHVPRSVRA